MAKRLGTRNIGPDIRQAHMMGRQAGVLTRSALDTWDALVTLHYGGREGICSHFREGTIAETGMAWDVVAPFAAPAGATLVNSILVVTTSTRNFLYQPMAATNTYDKLASVSMLATTAGDYVGLRLDDGTDNNYLEIVLYCSQVSPTLWLVRTRRRTGGGAVTTQDGDAMTNDPGCIVRMNMSGTRWTAWNAYPVLQTNMGFGGFMYKPQTLLGTANLAFTPTRAGVTFSAASGTFIANVDWFDIGRA